MCGNPNLDFAALERNAKYDGGFSAASPAVAWLWSIVREELSADEQRLFLKFFTGSDRCGFVCPLVVVGLLGCCVLFVFVCIAFVPRNNTRIKKTLNHTPQTTPTTHTTH